MASTTFEPIILVVANPEVDTSDPVFLSRKEHEKFAVWKAEDDAIANKSVSRVNAALASVIALGKRNLKTDPYLPKPFYGELGDIGHYDRASGIFMTRFNVFDPQGTRCPFKCRPITAFDKKEEKKSLLSSLRSCFTSRKPDAIPNPDDYTSLEEIIPGLPTRQLKFTHRMVEQRWFEAYKEDIARAYSGWDFKDMMLVSTIVVRQPLSPTPPPPPPSNALVLDIFLDNLPPDMRDSLVAELSIGSGRQHAA
ncbi:hypothetical protein EXIGLDRAFT_779795 [Exidia glandulosa HHB12029]|uniref:Uncharacterized protein n=1 Tax=Exidia glandulosa HHB12029 TaxID=1314781 RepID=A0A165ZC12_EXIGL|nr:hypothetical protein EXIGLDRAFT_779795 [Exidia glandulosa HHB12029]